MRVARHLGVPCPEVFVKYDPKFDATTIGCSDDHLIVLHSSLIDAFEADELAFVIGHEMGHIQCQHVTYLTIGHLISNGVGAFAKPLLFPLQQAISAWAREAELTADRAGLIATGSLDAPLRALGMFAAGSRDLMTSMNIQDYLSQETGLNTIHAKLSTWLSGRIHPYTVTRARRLLEYAASPEWQRLECEFRRNDMYNFDSKASRIPASPQLSLPGTNNETIKPRTFCSRCGMEVAFKSDRACPVCGAAVRR